MKKVILLTLITFFFKPIFSFGQKKDSLNQYQLAIRDIAKSIEKLKPKYPQLAEFSVAKNLDIGNLRIDYQYKTHRKYGGGWQSGVPNPDEDGIWFHIDFHSFYEHNQFYTQKLRGDSYGFLDKEFSYEILEGSKVRSIDKELYSIFKKKGIKELSRNEVLEKTSYFIQKTDSIRWFKIPIKIIGIKNFITGEEMLFEEHYKDSFAKNGKRHFFDGCIVCDDTYSITPDNKILVAKNKCDRGLIECDETWNRTLWEFNELLRKKVEIKGDLKGFYDLKTAQEYDLFKNYKFEEGVLDSRFRQTFDIEWTDIKGNAHKYQSAFIFEVVK